MNDDDKQIQRRKRLEAENSSLWARMTQDITPIDRRDVLMRPLGSPEIQKQGKPERSAETRVRETIILPQEQPQLKGREIDARLAQRLRKGQLEIEARIDLHGMNQIQAYDALKTFILNAAARQMRCVLVITGKGTPRIRTDEVAGEDMMRQKGVLRKRVPEWLEEAIFRDLILKIQSAQPKDGGSGAFYVLLRRSR